MDHHHVAIVGEDDKTQKKKNGIIQGTMKSVNRKHMSHCLTRHAGKGARDSFKIVHDVDDNIKIIKTHVNREWIEDEISKFNVKHFIKAHDDITHGCKIHKKLRQSSVRDRTLKGQLNREDCDNQKVCEFLKLIKRPTEDRREQEEKLW